MFTCLLGEEISSSGGSHPAFQRYGSESRNARRNGGQREAG